MNEDSLLHLPTLESKNSYQNVKIADKLSDEQKTEVADLLYEYRYILTDVPGTTNLGVHAIELTTEEPVRVKQYSPYSTRQVIKNLKLNSVTAFYETNYD